MATLRKVSGPGSDKLRAALKKVGESNVKVGWFDTSKYADDAQTPVAYVAAINELGPHARPFMKPTADARDAEWSALMFNLSKQIISGNMTVEQALEGLGMTVGADIQFTIANVYEPKLSLVTLMARKARLEGRKVTGATIGEFIAEIKAKGADNIDVEGISTKPLNDTGYMLATVSVSVNEATPTEVNPNAGEL